MASNEGKTLLSLLCGDKWLWDPGHSYSLRFHENGTGEIVACDALVMFILAEFDWKPVDTTASLTQPLELGDSKTFQFSISLTLTKRKIPQIGGVSTQRYSVNETVLEEGAFQPKEYTLRLEQGMFKPTDPSNPFYEWHRLRMVFSPSPYPPLEQWKRKQPAGVLRFWEKDTFYSQRIPEEEVTRRDDSAMEGNS
ncbi:hypothetical protein CDEST_14430 [Colletotrichum destructivum]|uniref:Uncharacterized protein n=1 Tax=Colletotrichum destructivum TaxID=34406 RepID=A0AAX4J1R4_9PEZI|nr:hypothetical protein CDEST_14430 [Colletotrichum destructivum]